jgi:pimeloyl-ACP methyl ester carboxylesterase
MTTMPASRQPNPGCVATPSPSEKRQAALNAALGDYLERRESPLAIAMRLYHEGQPLAISAGELHAAELDVSSRIVVFVHGLGQTEGCWEYPEHPGVTYGSLLREELGLVPFYVRYNTGRRISRNGRELSALLEQLALALPGVEEITLIGHSMGGLVIRSACHYAEALGHGWLRKARHCVYLGSPHLGAPLEKAGTWVATLLGSIDNPVVRMIHDAADLRGVGIQDLGLGCLLDEDWEGAAAASAARRPKVVPLAPNITHYFIAGSLTRDPAHVATLLLGDGLVRLPSATDPARRAGLPSAHWAIAAGVAHIHLSHSPDVYARIRAWFPAAPAPGGAEPRAAVAAPAPSSRAPGVAAKKSQLWAYLSLLADAVDQGAAGVQRVQEELTARPYSVLEAVPGLSLPAQLVRALHFKAMRNTYDIIRGVSRASGAALEALGGAAEGPPAAKPAKPSS